MIRYDSFGVKLYEAWTHCAPTVLMLNVGQQNVSQQNVGQPNVYRSQSKSATLTGHTVNYAENVNTASL